MSDCCCPPVPDVILTICPACGSRGAAVELQTVRALLTPEALRRVNVTQHRFCAAAACDVVYFDDTGNRFTRTDLRVPVWQKGPFGERTICYCFSEGESSVRAEIESSGSSAVVERIRAHIAARRCACDIRNPKGSCCLGDVIAAVRRVEESIALERVK